MNRGDDRSGRPPLLDYTIYWGFLGGGASHYRRLVRSPQCETCRTGVRNDLAIFCEGHMWAADFVHGVTGPFLLMLLMTLQHFAYTTWGPEVPFQLIQHVTFSPLSAKKLGF